MNYNLIIADDEEIEREAFKLMINKNLPEITVVDEAANGYELMYKADLYHPDLLIVDIEMPGISGIEAIKLLKQKNLSSKIIIHTAYSKFEYAQEALSLGADEYLLKPMKKEKIIETLRNCIHKIEESREKEQANQTLIRKIEELSPIVENDFISSIMMGECNADSLSVYLDILGIKFCSGFMMTCSFGDRLSLVRVKNEEISPKDVLQFLKTEINSICRCIVSPIVNGRISLFVPVDETFSAYRFKVWSIELARLIYEKTKSRFDVQIQIGIGQLYDNINLLMKSYRESVSALADRSITSRIKHYGDLHGETKLENPFQDCKDEVVKAILENDIERGKALLDTIFAKLEERKDDNVIQDMAFEFMLDLNKAILGGGVEMSYPSASLKSDHEKLSACRNYAELKALLEKTVEQIANLKRKEIKNKISGYVNSAIDLIRFHYAQNISLESIAEEIGVSPYYLCRLFKQETGKNFIDYLTEVRIQNALRLIREKDYTIRELSEKVGYNNLTYFSRVFKKVTGKTIGEMKNNDF